MFILLPFPSKVILSFSAQLSFNSVLSYISQLFPVNDRHVSPDWFLKMPVTLKLYYFFDLCPVSKRAVVPSINSSVLILYDVGKFINGFCSSTQALSSNHRIRLAFCLIVRITFRFVCLLDLSFSVLLFHYIITVLGTIFMLWNR